MTGILSSIFDVFSGVTDWFVDALSSATELFYTTGTGGGELTLIGYVTIIGFAIAVATMVLAWVRSVIRGQ